MISQGAAPTLEARGLSFGYGSTSGQGLVFAKIQLELRPGEIVSVIGQSGVGKSSLLRVLSGLLKPQEGSIWLRGTPLNKPSPAVAMVFQEARLLPWLTLEENVALGLNFKSQPKLSRQEQAERVANAIARVGLKQARNVRPAQLSGGMAQRAAFARYLARKPQVMLLDEPFAALDALTRSDLQQLLLSLSQRKQTTILLSTHDIDEALRLSDRVLLLSGRPARLVRCWHVERTGPERRPTSETALLELKRSILDALVTPNRSAEPNRLPASKESPYVQLV